ncbi:hypothetical protein BKA69DRAFT_1038858 [Paraphysoderma sedebokerense]|nr:hypothetical protein BKA69DRAFT_1038858 [Paraphysoderma sedebokerense]
MCLLGNSPDSSDCRDDYELIGFMPADTIDNDISGLIERTAKTLEKPFGDGIYLIDKSSTALRFGSRHFGNDGSKNVAICSVYAPRKHYLNTWSKIYVPRFIYDKITSLHYDQIRLNSEVTMRYLQALKKNRGIEPGKVFITPWGYNVMDNEMEVGNLMMISESKMDDLRFECTAEPPTKLSDKVTTNRIDTDLQWKSKLENRVWKFANYKPMNIVEVNEESGEMKIVGTTYR